MQRKKLILSLAVTFLVFGLSLGQVKKLEFEEYNLKNGLHVILYQDNSIPIVAVNVMYHVGSKNESSDRTGFAHFFEHLMFEGSPNIARGEYFRHVQNAGGDNNAGTSFDYTTYYEVLPSNQLALGLWLESERMLHLKVDSIGVETQRSVVKEERKSSYENQPYGSWIENIFSNAYTIHPYHWIPIGSAQYIDQATLPEFYDFYKHFYVPDNAVLVVAGDINKAETKKLIEQYFAEVPKGTIPIVRPNVKEPPSTSEVRKTVYDNIQLPALFVGYRIPPMGTDDFYALSMLQNLLSSGQSSILYKSLVDSQQLSVQSGAFPYALEDGGLFIIYSIANLNVMPDSIETAMDKEIEKVKAALIDEAVYQKLRNQTENEVVNSNSTFAGIAENLATDYTFYKNTGAINNEIDRYLKVTREDIKRVANQYLTKQNRVVLYYLSKQN